MDHKSHFRGLVSHFGLDRHFFFYVNMCYVIRPRFQVIRQHVYHDLRMLELWQQNQFLLYLTLNVDVDTTKSINITVAAINFGTLAKY